MFVKNRQKWQIMKNVSVIIPCFLLRGWARVVFNMQWGSFKSFLTILRAVETQDVREYILSTIADLVILFLTSEIFWAHESCTDTGIPIYRMFWLRPWWPLILRQIWDIGNKTSTRTIPCIEILVVSPFFHCHLLSNEDKIMK